MATGTQSDPDLIHHAFPSWELETWADTELEGDNFRSVKIEHVGGPEPWCCILTDAQEGDASWLYIERSFTGSTIEQAIELAAIHVRDTREASQP